LIDWISQAINVARKILKFLFYAITLFAPALPPGIRIPILAILGAVDKVAGLLPPAAED
jgi:hypothetical protein